MFRILGRWLVVALAILAVPHLVGGFYVESLSAALAVAAVLAVCNVLLRPILVILTLPLTIMTFGLFLFVINGFVFLLAGSLVKGIYIQSFGAAFFAALLVTVISWVIQRTTAY